MRRVNFRFLIAVIVCVLLFAGGVHALHTYQYANHIVALKKLVDDSKSSSNPALRIENLQRYVAIARDDAESLAELGTLLIEFDRPGQARLPLATALNLYEAQGNAAKVVEIRRSLIEIGRLTGRLGDAEFQLNQLLVPLAKSEVQVGALHIEFGGDGTAKDVLIDAIDPAERVAQAGYREQLAHCRAAQLRWAEAATELKKAIGLDSARYDAYGYLAEIQAEHLDQMTEAVATLATMVEQNPDVARVYLLRGIFRTDRLDDARQTSDASSIVQAFKAEAVQLARASDAAAVVEDIAPLTFEQFLDLAAADARRAVELDPDDLRALLLAMKCAHLYRGSVDRSIAEAQMEQAASYARTIIDNCEAQFVAQRTRAEEQRGTDWQNDLELKKAQGENVDTENQEVATKLSPAQEQSLRAAIYLPAVSAFNVLAEAAMFENKPEEALRALNDGLEKVEFDESLLLNLANLRIASPEEAVVTQDAELQSLIDRLKRRPKSAPLAAFLEARRMAAAGALEPAVTALRDAAKNLGRWPDAVAETYLTMGVCQLRLGRPTAAEDSFSRVLELRPTSIPALLGLGRAHEDQGARDDIDQALQIYQQLLQRQSEFTSRDQYRDLGARLIHVLKIRNAGLPADDPAWASILEILSVLRGDAQSNAEQITNDLLEVEVLVARGLIEAAEHRLQESAAAHSQSAQIWTALAQVQDYRWQQEVRSADESAKSTIINRAGATLDAAAAAITSPAPDERVSLLVARARHLVVMEGTNAAPALQQMANDALAANLPPEGGDPASRQERRAALRLFSELCALCVATGDVETATQLAERLRQSDSRDAGSRVMLFDLALRAQPDVNANAAAVAEFRNAQLLRLRELIVDIGTIHGMTFLAEYGEAVCDLKEFDAAVAAAGEATPEMITSLEAPLNGALKHLDNVAELRRRWSRLFNLRGEIHDRKQALLRSVDDPQWTKEFAAAAAAYEEAFQNGMRSPDFVAKLVLYLYQAGRYADAAKALTSLESNQAPNLVSVAQTAAELSDQLGDADQWSLERLAVEAAREAAEGDGADDAAVQLAYGNILLWNEQIDDAKLALRRVRELAPKDLSIWQQLILAQQRIEEARHTKSPDVPSELPQALRDTLAAAQSVLTKTEFGVLSGNAYQVLGDRTEAHARYLEELAAVPADLHEATASQIELLGQAALFLLQEGATNPESGQAGEKLLIRLDSEGGALYRELREARRTQGNRAEISAIERQLAIAVSTARRQLAALLMGRTDVVSQEAALAALSRNREIRYTDEDKRIEAQILSRSQNPERRKSAIPLLASVINGSLTPSPTDRLLLATMHLAEFHAINQKRELRERVYGESDGEVAGLKSESQGHLAAAREETRIIILSGSRATNSRDGAAQVDGAYVAALIQQIEILLVGNETADAEFYLEKLKQATPNSPTTAVIEARVRFALDEHSEVIALLLRLIAGVSSESQPGLMLSVAQLLEGFATQTGGDATQPPAMDYFQAAEQLLVKSAERGPNERMLLAGYYGRRGQTDEAVALITTDAAAAHVTDIASACSQVMAGIGRDERKVQLLNETLVQLRSIHTDSAALQLLHADICSWRGDAAMAETLYRGVLTAFPAHVVAANNLAFVLASQKKDLDEALKLINAAIEKKGEMPDLLDTRAFVRLRRGETELAIHDLSNAIQQKPSAAFLFHEAEARLAAGQQQGAQQSWELAERAGLAEDGIHPAERDSYRQLQSQLQSL